MLDGSGYIQFQDVPDERSQCCSQDAMCILLIFQSHRSGYPLRYIGGLNTRCCERWVAVVFTGIDSMLQWFSLTLELCCSRFHWHWNYVAMVFIDFGTTLQSSSLTLTLRMTRRKGVWKSCTLRVQYSLGGCLDIIALVVAWCAVSSVFCIGICLDDFHIIWLLMTGSYLEELTCWKDEFQMSRFVFGTFENWGKTFRSFSSV